MDQPAFPYRIHSEYPPGSTIQERFLIDLIAVKEQIGPTVHLGVITFPEAWAIFSALQLACRHPEWTGPTHWMVEKFARRVEKVITPTEAMREVARQGWEPKFGQPAEGKPT